MDNEYSVFFERVLNDARDTIDKIKSNGFNMDESDCRALAYVEGRVSVCYQVYRSKIHNPRLLEIADKRLDEIGIMWKHKQEPPAVTPEDVTTMKRNQLIDLCKRYGIVCDRKVDQMREALIKHLSKETVA